MFALCESRRLRCSSWRPTRSRGRFRGGQLSDRRIARASGRRIGLLQIEVGHLELHLMGTGRGDGEVDAAGGGDRGVGELGMLQGDAAQGLDQDIGHGREVKPQLVGAHGCRGGPVGEQLELLADAVLGLASGAVEVLVEGPLVPHRAGQRGDDEAGVGVLWRMLGLADDAAPAAPATQGGVAEVLEHSGRLALFGA